MPPLSIASALPLPFPSISTSTRIRAAAAAAAAAAPSPFCPNKQTQAPKPWPWALYGLQGDTVGSGRNIERIRVLWSKEDEARTPGVFYGAVSRAKEEEALAFDVETHLDDESMDTIGTSDEMGKRVRKTEEILEHAKDYRQVRMQVQDPHSNFPFASKEDFLVKIERLLRASRRVIHRRKDQRTLAGKDADGYVAELEACLNQWQQSLQHKANALGVEISAIALPGPQVPDTAAVGASDDGAGAAAAVTGETPPLTMAMDLEEGA